MDVKSTSIVDNYIERVVEEVTYLDDRGERFLAEFHNWTYHLRSISQKSPSVESEAGDPSLFRFPMTGRHQDRILNDIRTHPID